MMKSSSSCTSFEEAAKATEPTTGRYRGERGRAPARAAMRRQSDHTITPNVASQATCASCNASKSYPKMAKRRATTSYCAGARTMKVSSHTALPSRSSPVELHWKDVKVRVTRSRGTTVLGRGGLVRASPSTDEPTDLVRAMVPDHVAEIKRDKGRPSSQGSATCFGPWEPPPTSRRPEGSR